MQTNGLVPSPFGPKSNKVITKETFEKIKKLLGVESLFIATEDQVNNCDGRACLGHMTYFRSVGFNPHNLRGISECLMDYAEEIAASHENDK